MPLKFKETVRWYRAMQSRTILQTVILANIKRNYSFIRVFEINNTGYFRWLYFKLFRGGILLRNKFLESSFLSYKHPRD